MLTESKNRRRPSPRHTPARGEARRWVQASRRQDSPAACRPKRNCNHESNAQLGSCSRDPIGFEGSPWSLYAYTFAQPLFTSDPTGLYAVDSDGNRICGNKPRTDDECCADAKKLGKAGDSGGGVLCCDGRKVTCVWSPSTGLPDLDKIKNKCLRAHEDDHHDAIDCGGKVPFLDRPPFKDGKNRKEEECKAYKIELQCIDASAKECKTKGCSDAIIDRRGQILEIMLIELGCESPY